MRKEQALAVFENFKIRRVYDEKSEMWLFSVVDIMAALTQQPDYQTARKYWNKLKERLKKEGSESVTNCHQLKLEAADKKKYTTDVASPETLLRLIQSVPSPKAEPIKLWLAKVGYERIQDMSDPARSLDRGRGYSCYAILPARKPIFRPLSEAVKKAPKNKNDEEMSTEEKKELTEAEKEYKSKRKQIQEKLIKFGFNKCRIINSQRQRRSPVWGCYILNEIIRERRCI